MQIILAADDDPQILRLVTRNLQLEGYDVVGVANGQEALDQIEAHILDLVIFDVMMPELAGFAVREFSSVPIILVTARGQDQDKMRGLDSGADDYLTKPFSVNELLADGRRIEADITIANADLPYVYDYLLPPDASAKKLAHKKYSCSTVSFFWGVEKVYPQLQPHTLFLADEYQENFARIAALRDLPDNPSLYVHAPARLDPDAAPPGQDTVIAVVPVGHLDGTGKQDWRRLRARARQAVFNRLTLLGITDLQAHLKFEVSYVPLSWRKRYNLMQGATHGLSHTLTQLGYLRPHNRHPHFHNLYFVGASTHPGTGVPTALVCARLVADRVEEDWHTRLSGKQPA